jgi:hypothetical protein
MSRPLVAFSRKLDAIDLTASLWLARLDETDASARRQILWIADPRGGYTGVQSDLESLAHLMRPAFSVEVISYAEAWRRSSFKAPADLFARIRDEVIGSRTDFPCTIRIHHGSVDVGMDPSRPLQAHCLEFRGQGEEAFGVSPSGRPGTWTTAVPSDVTGISGSLHLYLARSLGEVVNLPWYALAPSLGSFAVRESISPVAFYSADRYSDDNKKLKPTGYSLIDYPHLWLAGLGEKTVMPSPEEIEAYSLLLSDYPRTSGRIGPKAPGSAELACKLYSHVRQQVLAGKITTSLSGGILSPSVPPASIIDSVLTIAVVARALESVDRGHVADAPPALLDVVRASGLLDAARADQVDILLKTHKELVRRAAQSVRGVREDLLAGNAYRRFGEIARLCVVTAAVCAEATLLDLAVRLKASVPTLAKILDGNGCAMAFDSLAEARSDRRIISTAGSVLNHAN